MTKESDPINYSKEEQGEFFSEFQASGGNKFAYFKKEMALGKKMVLSISYENLVLFFIVLIMLVVVFFSLGVEKGKRVAAKYMRTWAAAHAKGAAEKKEGRENPEESSGKSADLQFKPYTIQVMAVKKIEEAQREVARLNDAGYKAFIVQSSAWYHVCAGRYINAAESSKDLAAIKEKYPASYIRNLKNRTSD